MHLYSHIQSDELISIAGMHIGDRRGKNMGDTNGACTVLILDDDELLITLLEHKLGQRGLHVLSATDGQEGLMTAIETRPDLIVLDGMMPTMDGFEVLRNLKERPDTKEIPVVMLSARRLEHDIVNGLNLGAADYLVKPFMPEELFLKIQRLLSERWPAS